METLVNELLKSLTLVDVAGLAAVAGLALYGMTGIGNDDGLDGTSDSSGDD